MTRIMFEKLHAQTVLFLCVSGRTTDVMTDSDSVSHTVPIYEDYALLHVIIRVTNRDLTQYLMKTSVDEGTLACHCAHGNCARHQREPLCYIGLNYDTEFKRLLELIRRRATSSQAEISSLSTPNVSITLKHYSRII